MTDMRKDIEAILGECVGEDLHGGIMNDETERVYNMALTDMRNRIPETARKVMDRVMGEVEKTKVKKGKLTIFKDPNLSMSKQQREFFACGYIQAKQDIIASLAGEDEGDNGKEV